MALLVGDNLTFTLPPPGELPADSAEVAALAGHLRAGRCALFVGAGLSAPAGLPTWGALIDRMIVESTPWAVDPALFPNEIDMSDPVTEALREPAIDAIRSGLGRALFSALCRRIRRVRGTRFDLQVVDKALHTVYADSLDRVELRRLAANRRYAELAGDCRNRLGRERFHHFIRQTLTAPHEVPATHRDIVRTPYSCVVTTNFDTLIEDAYARHGGRGIPRAPTGAELGQHGTLLLDRAFFVLKAHGDAARPQTMVFTADDYRRVIHETPAFQAILGGILLTQAVLFVGYSLSDTNFRLLLDNQLTIFNGNVPPRYAILGGVGKAEREILWRTAKLQVLPYPDGQHHEVGRCLAALADQTAPGPMLPVSTARVHARPGARRARNVPCSTLFIESDGERLALELVRQQPDGGAERKWVGGAPHPDTRSMGGLLRSADQAQGLDRSPMGEIFVIGSRLARLLPAPLRRLLGRLPKGELVEVACSSAATRVPWEWTLVAGQPLGLHHAVVRRPVDITHQARGRRAVNRPLRALVFGDAGSGNGRDDMPLPFADLEAAAIVHLLRNGSPRALVTRLSRETATHGRVLSELEGGDYDLIHFGGHAWFDDREAYFYLWDRIMLGSELAPLLSRRPPALMMLDTHYTAFVLAEVDADVSELVGSPTQATGSAPRGDPRGFADAAMRCGVTSFVGAFGSVCDRSGAELSVAFYAHLTTGATVAEALRAARRSAARVTKDAGMFYTVFGYADFRLVQPQDARSRMSVSKSLAEVKARTRWPQ
jgi:hypothetical protein